MKNEVKHTAHSSYRCQYHIVFAPKYRRKVIFKQIRKDIGQILRKLCNEMKVEIIEAEACVDHIHMLVRGRRYSPRACSRFSFWWAGVREDGNSAVVKGLLCDPGGLVAFIHRYELYFMLRRYFFNLAKQMIFGNQSVQINDDRLPPCVVFPLFHINTPGSSIIHEPGGYE